MAIFLIVLFITLTVYTPESSAEVWPISPQDCLAATIYHEARGEPLVGQYLVAHVVLNRVHSVKYPNDICEVVKQPWQFSWFNSRTVMYPTDIHAWEVAKSITTKFILGRVYVDLSEGALFYHANYVNPSWSARKTFIIEIAQHKFYR